MKITGLVIIITCLCLLTSCAPQTFISTSVPNWNVIEFRKDISSDKAWKIAVDTIAQKFDIEVLDHDGGYIRTSWSHNWTGKLNDDYRVRALIKFLPDWRSMQIRSEAEYRSSRGWVMGEDERLTQILKTDLMGKLGRVTR